MIPLRGRQGIIGVLDLQSTQLDAFTEQDRRIINTFAGRAAAAIENMMLYEETQRYAADLESRVAERTTELRQANDQLQAILDNAPTAIYVKDLNGRYLLANQMFRTFFGKDDMNVSGNITTDIFSQEVAKEISEHDQEVLDTKSPVRFETIIPNQSTTSTYLSIKVPLSDENGMPYAICGISTDITALKHMEVELRDSLAKERELNDLKSRFVSMVSHEFRTPLTIIYSSSEMLTNYYDRLEDKKRGLSLKESEFQRHPFDYYDG